MRPTQGRIVLYTTLTGSTWPAIVVAATSEGWCTLSVFAPECLLSVDNIPPSPTGEPMPGHWHWPPRVSS